MVELDTRVVCRGRKFSFDDTHHRMKITVHSRIINTNDFRSHRLANTDLSHW